MTLRLGWWNSGLQGRTAPTQHELDAASRVIRALRAEVGCDLVAVCEVRPTYAEALVQRVVVDSNTSAVTDQPSPAIEHNFALFFNPARVMPATDRVVQSYYARHRACAGLVYSLAVPRSKTLISLAMCHWPAQGMGDVDHADTMRQASAQALRAALTEGDQFRDCLLLGDFNAEPFDGPLVAMGGTRDIEQVRLHPDLLYNLAWRWLGSMPPYAGRVPMDRAGTYRLASGRGSRWRTFDQALVSANFLRGEGWSLREGESSPRHIGALRGPRGAYLATQFDHLPLVVTLEYISPHAEGSDLDG